MQTFLPYPDYAKSAQSLDDKRLGKQRVECLQILHALTDPSYGWQNHPAVRMWRGHERALQRYGAAICIEWRLRGFKDTCLEKILTFSPGGSAEPPPWFGQHAFHHSHQSKLVYKLREHYAPQFGELDEVEYVWPV